MPTASEISKLKQRSGSGLDLPVPEFRFSAFPKKVTSAFPELGDWLAAQNVLLARHIQNLNTLQKNTSGAITQLQP